MFGAQTLRCPPERQKHVEAAKALNDGRALLKIPPGTQSGQKLRLREKGVPSATKEGARGDEIVEVKITVPMPQDEETKDLLRRLAKLNSQDPRADLWRQV